MYNKFLTNKARPDKAETSEESIQNGSRWNILSAARRKIYTITRLESSAMKKQIEKYKDTKDTAEKMGEDPDKKWSGDDIANV